MRRAILLLAVCAIVARGVYAARAAEVALLDHNDELKSIRSIALSEERHGFDPSELTPPKVTYNTPQYLVDAVRENFKENSYSLAVNWTFWEREFEDFFPCGVRVLYHVNDDEMWPAQDPCDIPPGYWAWLLTEDGQFNFGRVYNFFEWPVRHLHLAAWRPVYAAGEMRVTEDNTTIWDFSSGSFTVPIFRAHRGYDKVLLQKMEAVLKVAAKHCERPRKFKYTPRRLLPHQEPSWDEIQDLCAKYPARFHNVNCSLAPHAKTDASFAQYSETPLCDSVPLYVAYGKEPPALGMTSRSKIAIVVVAVLAAAGIVHLCTKRGKAASRADYQALAIDDDDDTETGNTNNVEDPVMNEYDHAGRIQSDDRPYQQSEPAHTHGDKLRRTGTS